MRTKIYYNLRESKYRIIIGEITFVFSSIKNFNTFVNNWKDFVLEQNTRASVRNKVAFDGTQMQVIRYYQTIEKRGFYILINGREITCQNQISAKVQLIINQN